MPNALLPLAETLRPAVVPLASSSGDYTPLLPWIGEETTLVVLSETTSGTHEFVRARAAITKTLIQHLGFSGVAIDADWHAAKPVDQLIQNPASDALAIEALSAFQHFPGWLWRNAELIDLISWLRAANENRQQPIRFYGLDLLPYHRTLWAFYDWIRRDHRSLLPELQEYLATLDPPVPADELDPAPVIETAIFHFLERQPPLRPVFRGNLAELLQDPVRLQNRRDCQMMHALEAILHHSSAQKIVIWMHHYHGADSRAREATFPERASFGQLLRERYAARVKLIGLTTHHGTVAAAPAWGSPPERVPLPPPPSGGVECLLHEVEIPRFLLSLLNDDEPRDILASPLPQRPLGSVYDPGLPPPPSVEASLAEQYDIVIHFDETRAVEPLEEDF